VRLSTTGVLSQARAALRTAGLRGCLLVRDLRTGEELAIDPDRPMPAASLVKVPLAMATLERVRLGIIDGSSPVTVAPGRLETPGPVGISRFRHPVSLYVEDLVHLSTSLSDNSAADALFALTPPDEVTAGLRRWAVDGFTVRHDMSELTRTPVELFPTGQTHLAHVLASAGSTPGSGHVLAQLDITRASIATARACADVLQLLWTPSVVDPGVARRVRDHMAAGVHRQRLTPDFVSDASRWSSKTGTLLHLRHEMGVVEHDDGQGFVIVALTESEVAAVHQPQAEAAMAHAARYLRDALRKECG